MLDGRNRLAAISRIADEHRRAELLAEVQRSGKILPAGTDPLAYVFSANFCRRQWKAADRRKLICKLLEAYPDLSDRAIASLVGVSHTTVAAVRSGSNGQSGHTPAAERREASGRKARGRKAGSTLTIEPAAKRAMTPANSPTGRGEITGPPATRTCQEVEWIARLLQAVTALAAMPADTRYIVDIVRSSTSAEPVAARMSEAFAWFKQFCDAWDQPATGVPLLASSWPGATEGANRVGIQAMSSHQMADVVDPICRDETGRRAATRTGL